MGDPRHGARFAQAAAGKAQLQRRYVTLDLCPRANQNLAVTGQGLKQPYTSD